MSSRSGIADDLLLQLAYIGTIRTVSSDAGSQQAVQ